MHFIFIFTLADLTIFRPFLQNTTKTWIFMKVLNLRKIMEIWLICCIKCKKY